jgi:hypothetical protein
MSDTIDGTLPLADQESGIRFKEGKGYELTALAKGASDPPTNTAEFKRLPLGERPVRIHLVEGGVPDGETEVWTGRIYIEGKVRQAAAYRKAED